MKRYQLIAIKKGRERRIKVFIDESAKQDFIDMMEWTDEMWEGNTREVLK